MPESTAPFSVKTAKDFSESDSIVGGGGRAGGGGGRPGGGGGKKKKIRGGVEGEVN